MPQQQYLRMFSVNTSGHLLCSEPSGRHSEGYKNECDTVPDHMHGVESRMGSEAKRVK